jgi:hypothetical protein
MGIQTNGRKRLVILTLVVTLSLVSGAESLRAAIQEIDLPGEVDGTLGAGEDAFPFFAAAGTMIKVTVDADAPPQVSVLICGPDGGTVDGLVTKLNGDRVEIAGALPVGGMHTIVVAAKNGASGAYRMYAKGKSPSAIRGTAEMTTSGEQTISFVAVEGTALSSIKIKRTSDTLDLVREGTLEGPSGTVALGRQKAKGKSLVASRAILPVSGTYRFRFTPDGTGSYKYKVKLKAPRSSRSSHALPTTGQAWPQNGPGVSVSVSAPPNGTHFVADDRPWVVAVLNDDSGNPLTLEDLSTANLYMYGPQNQALTTTAVGLLRASTDRNARPHHYIDLKNNTDVVRFGNVVAYPLSAVTDELPGTYTATLWSRLSADNLQQWMPAADCQIKTPDPEAQIVEREMCGSCHEGAESGKYYLHHIDPGYSPTGNHSLDAWPVRTCKSCHNQDGYAGYNNGTGSGDGNVDRTPDPIIRRVHGVHMGADLQNPFNNDPDNGDFSDYIHVEFPADVRDCTRCHVDDRWKTMPARLACGACHDNIWFGDPVGMPATAEAHPGGPQADDAQCSTCHTPESPGASPITEAHFFEYVQEYTVTLTLSDPANGEYYVSGETPTLAIGITDKATGTTVDPNTITRSDWSRVRLQVSGPRARTFPVLTSAAADNSLSGSTSYIYNDLRVQDDPLDEDPRLSRSATAMTYQLSDVDGLSPGTFTVFVQARRVTSPSSISVINFQVGTATVEPQIATNCADCHGKTNMHGSYPFALAPDICKNCHDYDRQLEGMTSWDERQWGFGAAPLSRRVHGLHFGHYLDKPEDIHGEEDAEHYSGIIFPQDIRNCTKCHAESSTWTQKPARLACLACHDSDQAQLHGMLMTFDPTPDDPWSGDEEESCTVCHGDHAGFAPSVVHNVWEPYAPPYRREAEDD